MSPSALARSATRTLVREPDGGVVRRTTLPSGLRVVTEFVPGVRSVAVGVWAAVGSVDESANQAGCSHYLEHLLFKGTTRRSALDISAAIDARGGEMNAFTAKEYTCFYARVLDADTELALDVLADMITSSTVRAADVDAERSVVLEEIAMRDDDPADAVHDLFDGALFGDGPLGRPVIGTTASIQALSRRTVHAYYRRHYRADSLVLSVAGRVDHARVVASARRAFAGLEPGAPARRTPAQSAPAERTAADRVVLGARTAEQAHLVLGLPGLARSDPRRYTLAVLNAVLGGGMSSRLFQAVREQRGLAYSVYSYVAGHQATGGLGVYAGVHPRRLSDCLEVITAELDAVAADGLSGEELDRGRGQVAGSIALGLEDSGSRMSRVGKAEMLGEELVGLDTVLARVAAVSADDVATLAAQLFAAPRTLAVVGPVDDPAPLAFAVGG